MAACSTPTCTEPPDSRSRPTTGPGDYKVAVTIDGVRSTTERRTRTRQVRARRNGRGHGRALLPVAATVSCGSRPSTCDQDDHSSGRSARAQGDAASTPHRTPPRCCGERSRRRTSRRRAQLAHPDRPALALRVRQLPSTQWCSMRRRRSSYAACRTGWAKSGLRLAGTLRNTAAGIPAPGVLVTLFARNGGQAALRRNRASDDGRRGPLGSDRRRAGRRGRWRSSTASSPTPRPPRPSGFVRPSGPA